jgi:hypothetical protein
MSKMSNSNHDPEMLDEYDFSQGVRGKYFQRYRKVGNEKPRYGSALDLICGGASVILSLFPLTAPIGAAGSFGLLAWQNEQLNKFKDELQKRLEALDQNKLDQSALQSDEFKSLVVQAVETASQTGSDLKKQALASALVNSLVLPTSRFTGKQALQRILSQLSDEEIIVLKVLYHEDSPFGNTPSTTSYTSQISPDGSSRLSLGMSEADIAEILGWTEENTLVACQSLLQLGLVHQADSYIGPVLLYSAGSENRGWRITALAEKLISWCRETPIEQQ